MISAPDSFFESRFFIEVVFAALVNLVVVFAGHLLHVAGLPVLLAVFAFGTVLLHLAGIAAYLPFLLLLVVWNFATRAGLERKRWIGYIDNEVNSPAPGKLAAYCAVPVLFSLTLPYHYFQPELIILAVVSGLAAAVADVVSSEIGVIVSNRPVLLLEMRRTFAGASGAISVEGTIEGIVAASAVAIAGWLVEGYAFADVWIVIVCSTVGNAVDSLLGNLTANRLKRSSALGNARNLLSVGVACLVAFALSRLSR